MLRDSRDIKRRLEREGWYVARVRGSHRVFIHKMRPGRVILPHPRHDLGIGLVREIYDSAGWEKD